MRLLLPMLLIFLSQIALAAPCNSVYEQKQIDAINLAMQDYRVVYPTFTHTFTCDDLPLGLSSPTRDFAGDYVNRAGVITIKGVKYMFTSLLKCPYVDSEPCASWGINFQEVK